MSDDWRPPAVADPGLVGSYSARAGAGGGYVWDAVLEYRVWCHPHDGSPDLENGNDYFYAFASYDEALAFSQQEQGTESPLALVLQSEYLDEPEPGEYRHVKEPRRTEWPVELLRRPRRTPETIPSFLAPEAPANRLDILRGLAPPRSLVVDVRWADPWRALTPERATTLADELRNEVPPEHTLDGRNCKAVAMRSDRDDVLFVVDDRELAIVHLTWKPERDPRWPQTLLVPDVATFVRKHLEPDHAAFVGSDG
ncbi:MAG: hypothetical protein AAGF12_25370 [Myxococcota bacterium]